MAVRRRLQPVEQQIEESPTSTPDKVVVTDDDLISKFPEGSKKPLTKRQKDKCVVELQCKRKINPMILE